MNSRLSLGLIWVLALGALLSALWAITHLAALTTPSPFGSPDTFVIWFSRRTLDQVPKLFPIAISTYAVAVLSASSLAMLVSIRAAQLPAALWLGGALSGLAFFTAHFLFIRHVPQLAAMRLVYLGDYVAMTAFSFGCWAAMCVSFTYPRPIDVDAYQVFLRKKRRLRYEKMPLLTLQFGRRLRQVDEKVIFLTESVGRGTVVFARSQGWPWGLSVFGWISVALWQIFGHERWSAGLVIFLPCAFGVMAILAYSVLNWQYYDGKVEDKARIAWLVFGLMVAGLLWFVPLIGTIFWLFCGGGERAGEALVVINALGFPVIAIVLVWLWGVSIFFFGAIDPRMAIRKTSVYGFAALLLAVALAIVQGSVATQLAHKFGLPGNAGLVLAAAMVGLVFAPLRSRIERRVERLVERVLPASTLADAHRETVTVVFGDMSGYTELSARDEPTALTLASLLHKESRRLAERHDGRLVKSIGDAVLLAFNDPGEAAVCCLELREKVKVAAGGLNLPALPLHFGVHTGEVVRDQDGDIFGGTVNLAARLQGQAGPGEIVVSEAVATVLKDGNFSLRSLGAKALKNVPMPVNCFLVG